MAIADGFPCLADYTQTPDQLYDFLTDSAEGALTDYQSSIKNQKFELRFAWRQ